MACFIVPAAEAAVSTIVTKKLEKKEKTNATVSRMKWLNNMLWGGSALLAFEHVWHGEVVPFFPFLTAAKNAQDAMAMLHEMSTTGVLMAALVTVAWVGMAVVSTIAENSAAEQSSAK